MREQGISIDKDAWRNSTLQFLERHTYFTDYCKTEKPKSRYSIVQNKFRDWILPLLLPDRVAAILRWRGKGRFKLREQQASDHHIGLLLTETGLEREQEIHPAPQALLYDLIWKTISNRFMTAMNYTQLISSILHEALTRQEAYLKSITSEEWRQLVALYKLVRNDGIQSSNFQSFHKKLYAMSVIFDFAWSKWIEGAKRLQDTKADYSGRSLLECSLFLTFIFRSDRFNDVEIKDSFSSGALGKIMQRVEDLT